MLQANEIEQRLNHIQQTIGEAEQVCRAAGSVPQQLQDCIDRLWQESNQVRQVMQSQDQQRIIECVDNLESISDEAKRASRSQPNMSANLENAVTRVHAELSELKHQLH
ncbi:MAG: hypothetical protein ABIT83_14155 [Massilia sp.]